MAAALAAPVIAETSQQLIDKTSLALSAMNRPIIRAHYPPNFKTSKKGKVTLVSPELDIQLGGMDFLLATGTVALGLLGYGTYRNLVQQQASQNSTLNQILGGGNPLTTALSWQIDPLNLLRLR